MTEVGADIIYYCTSSSIKLQEEVINLFLHCVTTFQNMKEKIVDCIRKDSSSDLIDHVDKILEDYRNEDKYCIVYFHKNYREKEFNSKLDIPPLTGCNDLSNYIKDNHLNGKTLAGFLAGMEVTILCVTPNFTNTKLLEKDSYGRTLWRKSNLEEVNAYIERVLSKEEADEFNRSIVTHYQQDLSDRNFCVVYYHEPYRTKQQKPAFGFCNAVSEFIKSKRLDSENLLEYLNRITRTIIYISESPLRDSHLFDSDADSWSLRLVRKTSPKEVKEYVEGVLEFQTDPQNDACTVHIHHKDTKSLRSWGRISEFITLPCTLDREKLLAHLCPPEEIWLIVGLTDGLETELDEDIRQVCKKASMDDKRIEQILQESLYTDTETYGKINETSGKCFLRIIVSPTVEEFERLMSDAIKDCCSMSLTIVYCGHGTVCGSICLFDDIYRGIDLKELLEKNKRKNNLRMNFYFNCCYAINIVSGITETNALQKLIKLANFILEVPNDPDFTNAGVQTVLKSYYGDQNENEKLFKQWRDKVHACCFNLDNFYLVPLSVGVLKSQGLLYIALNQKLPAERSAMTHKIKMRTPRCYHDWTFLTENPTHVTDTDVKKPTVTVFQAGRGDSALFSWGKWNVLIDGGIEWDPCFLSKIRTLPRLDLVVLTHGDTDHVNGLQTLFDKLPNGEFVKLAAYLLPDEIPKHRTWSHVTKLHCATMEAGIPLHDLKTKEFDQKFIIKFIHPPSGSIKERALEKLKEEWFKNNSRGLTLINQSSLVVYIECCGESFLFTGDADGKDVIEALKIYNLNDKTFSYVDMPHHGSKYNHPKEFLEAIKTTNIIVSTNGNRFNHPHADTIEELKKYMEGHLKCHLYFNYEERYTTHADKLSTVKERVHYRTKDDASCIKIEIP